MTRREREYTLYPGGITFPTAADARSALREELERTASAYVTTPTGKRLKIARPKRKQNPKLPTGRFIPCEGVVLDSEGRVKKMKIREKDLRRVVKRNPSGKRQYELTFWGGTSIRYKRWHADLESARTEAKRVYGKMTNRAAHPAVIYGPDNNEYSA